MLKNQTEWTKNHNICNGKDIHLPFFIIDFYVLVWIKVWFEENTKHEGGSKSKSQ